MDSHATIETTPMTWLAYEDARPWVRAIKQKVPFTLTRVVTAQISSPRCGGESGTRARISSSFSQFTRPARGAMLSRVRQAETLRSECKGNNLADTRVLRRGQFVDFLD